jgi:nucleotide-binding universal stress UspA family protein
MFQNILVALDSSNIGSRVFQEALTLAKATGAHLMLLHVLSPFEEDYPNMPVVPGLDSYYPMYNAASEEYMRRWKAFEQNGLDLLQKRTDEATALGIPTEFTQNTGDPGRIICNLAHNWNADLIIMGRRGRTGLSELVLGSVSNYVLHHAACSVLVVQGETDTPTETPQTEEVAALR